MKYTFNFKLILSVCLCAFLAASCVKEGPMGPPGEDGADGADGRDGVDGNVTCLVCHATENIESINAEFAMSGHFSGEKAVAYAGSRQGCAECHSHEGFVQYAEFGEVLGDITNPSAWECKTCHSIHETFDGQDYALRLNDPINPESNPGMTMDLGGSNNLCANCHQSRRPEPNTDSPGETFYISNTHYGPHHGAQANVLYGIGFAEVEGDVDYPEAGSSYHMGTSCVGCHMGEYGNGGGHSWKANLDACIDCHGSDMDDFNYGNGQALVESQLNELRDKLIELGVVAGDEEDGYHPVVGEYPMEQAQAFFNWIGLVEDRSLGAHNPKYVKALLANTLEALEEYE
jgi:mono/diheme cytochrome c family protein